MKSLALASLGMDGVAEDGDGMLSSKDTIMDDGRETRREIYQEEKEPEDISG